MEVKAEAPNGTPVVKNENQNQPQKQGGGGGPSGGKFNNNNQGGMGPGNQNLKKNPKFQPKFNRNAPPGGGPHHRGPPKGEVS